MTSLKDSATKGVIWSAIEKFSVQGVQFVISIALARLLMPSDFGVIGMISIFIAISTTFVNSGMSSGLIQRQNRTELDYSTVFVFNAVVSVLFYALLYLTAPYIATFYKTPLLTPIMRVIGLNIVISAFAVVQRSRLTIDLDFKTLAKVNVSSVLVSGGIAIYCAYTGFGVWSLVYKQLAAALISVALLWYYSRWKPSLSFSKESFNNLFGFGSKLLIAGIYAQVFQNIYNLAIGKYYSSKELGHYTQAKSISEVVAGTVSSILSQVTFPLLSELQGDKKRMISIFRRIIRMSSFVIFPAMTCLAVLADPFVNFFLGAKWSDTIPLLQLMCFARIFYPLSVLNLSLLNSNGRSDLFLKVDLSKAPLIILGLWITIPLGVEAMVIANLIIAAISYLINAYMPGKLFGYGIVSQLKEVWLTLVLSATMGLVVVFILSFFNSDLLKLLVGVFASALSYLGLSYLFKVRELDIFFNMARDLLRNR